MLPRASGSVLVSIIGGELGGRALCLKWHHPGEGRGGAVPRMMAYAAKPHPNPPLKGRGKNENNASPEHYHPGEGRGPIGKAKLMKGSPSLAMFPNWAPAFAGVVRSKTPGCRPAHHR